jgi:hypothetical protein
MGLLLFSAANLIGVWWAVGALRESPRSFAYFGLALFCGFALGASLVKGACDAICAPLRHPTRLDFGGNFRRPSLGAAAGVGIAPPGARTTRAPARTAVRRKFARSLAVKVAVVWEELATRPAGLMPALH